VLCVCESGELPVNIYTHGGYMALKCGDVEQTNICLPLKPDSDDVQGNVVDVSSNFMFLKI